MEDQQMQIKHFPFLPLDHLPLVRHCLEQGSDPGCSEQCSQPFLQASVLEVDGHFGPLVASWLAWLGRTLELTSDSSSSGYWCWRTF